MIFLTGAMGVGKTAVGQCLARKMGWQLIDLDRKIEDSAGISIKEIFRQFGETHFRNLESMALLEIVDKRACVVALGGGVLESPGNLKNVLESGSLVWLRAQPETILKRLNSDELLKRPLLAAGDALAILTELLESRRQNYAKAALAVDTDGLGLEEVAEKISNWWQRG